MTHARTCLKQPGQANAARHTVSGRQPPAYHLYYFSRKCLLSAKTLEFPAKYDECQLLWHNEVEGPTMCCASELSEYLSGLGRAEAAINIYVRRWQPLVNGTPGSISDIRLTAQQTLKGYSVKHRLAFLIMLQCTETINKKFPMFLLCIKRNLHWEAGSAPQNPWADGGGQGARPPLAHVVGFLTLGLKLDPLLDPPFLLGDLRWTPPPHFKKPVNA